MSNDNVERKSHHDRIDRRSSIRIQNESIWEQTVRSLRLSSFDGKHSVFSPLFVKYVEKVCLCITFIMSFVIRTVGTERGDYLYCAVQYHTCTVLYFKLKIRLYFTVRTVCEL